MAETNYAIERGLGKLRVRWQRAQEQDEDEY